MLAKHHYTFLYGIVLAVCIGASLPIIAGLDITEELLVQIELKYNKFARQRVESWQELIKTSQDLTEDEKLNAVNSFFNANVLFIDDLALWGKEDYWATPLQTLVTNGGDCEDFSIAKYFTLREMGVPDESMRLTYVKALELNQAHMVLTYYPSPESEPLVLDNLIAEIKPSDEREDLLPVYSFNGDGLWLAKSRLGEAKHVGRADRLGPWRDVIARINSEYTP